MFYAIRNHTVFSQPQPPAGLRPIAALHGDLLPPVVFKLHESLRAWGRSGAFARNDHAGAHLV
jgi:hypothetical protein